MVSIGITVVCNIWGSSSIVLRYIVVGKNPDGEVDVNPVKHVSDWTV